MDSTTRLINTELTQLKNFIKTIVEKLKEEQHKAPSYAERVAYTKALNMIKEGLDE